MSTTTDSQGTWFSQMQPQERKTFWGCFTGWALDAFDVQLYSLVIPLLLSLHFIRDTAQAGLIATVALLSSAVGGWLAGVLSDRIGRVRTLQLTVLWFSVFTALSGLAQDANQLMLARGLMGFGFGGEWAAGAVLIGETVRPAYRGRAVGTVQSGWAIGWGIAVLAFTLVTALAPTEWSWRILFFLGILPALLVLYLRKHVKDPEISDIARRSEQARTHSPLLAIFSPRMLKTTVLCSLLAVGAQGGYYALTTWLPQFLSATRGLKVMALGGTLIIIIAGAFAGYLFGAWFTDKVGRRWALILCSVGAIVMVLPFTLLSLPNIVFVVLCFPLGFFSSAYFSGMGAFFTEQFPTEFRGSGQGFAYNFGRGIGALFPFLVGSLAARISIGPAIALFACVAYGVLAIAALLLPETRGRELHQATDFA
ncbi:MFS transporter [Enemella dayhoffiae]|uniref:MFS transporter n=1 Tax=Enemella dayhoffiae TaxID=2016507 RepID=A0A255H0S0_9ACTN|nr:MFS transporter [Enemella dayhoffiae]OYO20753.1 MFS transporter [Enemella dayhoffiae]